MENMTTQSPAAKLKWVLLAALALLMAWVAWSAYTQSKENLVQLGSWKRHDAQLLLVAVLAGCWLWLSVTPWPGDRTWTHRAWRATDPTAVRAAAGALLAEPIKEPRGNQKIWAVLGLVIALPFALWTLTAIGAHPLEAGVQLVVLLGILSLSVRSVVKVHTRRVRFDQAGLSDTDFFGVRRVPWDAVKSMKLVNLNARAQRLYDRTRLRDRVGSRPEDDMGAWDVCGEQGVVLLRLYRSMLPEDALSALRERIQQQLRDGGKDVFGFAKQGPAPAPQAPAAPGLSAAEAQVYRSHGKAPPRAAAVDPFEQEVDARIEDAEMHGEGGRVLDPSHPRDRKLIEEHEAIGRRMDTISKSIERVMKGFMALVFLVPLAGTSYLAYQSLWFKFAGMQAIGRVVAIAAEYQPALVVEYSGAGEQMLRTKSDPSEDNVGVAVGAEVRVFYDPADPERVRLDLFDEMWFSVLALGGLTLFVGLLAGAVWWGTMRTAKTKSNVRRAA